MARKMIKTKSQKIELFKEEIEKDRRYKKEKAKRFIDLGYYVKLSDSSILMIDIYPHQIEELEAEIKASVNFSRKPLEGGLENGRINELIITCKVPCRHNPLEEDNTDDIYPIFNFNRWQGFITPLNKYNHPRAIKLYEDILRELN